MESSCHFAGLKTIFGVPPSSKAAPKQNQWLNCVVWDEEILKEFKDHDECDSKLHTKMYFGRALYNSLVRDMDNFRLLSQMDWKEPFILIDIFKADMGVCNHNKYIRVCETPTWNNIQLDTSPRAKIWDLIIFPECTQLAEEMVRLKSLGVKTTVAIWNSETVQRYPEPFIDGDDEVLGEILLKTRSDNKILTVVIFHHESVSEARVPQQAEGICEQLTQKYFTFRADDHGKKDHLAVFVKYYYNSAGDQRNQISFHENVMTANREKSSIKVDENNVQNKELETDGGEGQDVEDDEEEYFDSYEFVLDTEQGSEVSTISTDVLKEVNDELYALASRFILHSENIYSGDES